MSEYVMSTPLDRKQLRELRTGDRVLLSGTIYTSRDAGHKRMAELLEKGEPLPLELDGQCIYYAGPTPAPPGKVIGSVGPTTAGRMDRYAPLLIEKGLAAMIGKGARSSAVHSAMQKHGAVYFGFTGGAGALAAACIKECEVIAWEDLGSEAMRRLVVKDFPLVVLADSIGGDLYTQGREEYLACSE